MEGGILTMLRHNRPNAAFVNVYDRVALTEDVPEHHLLRGQVGTVVEILSGDLFEVAFSERDGQLVCALHANKLTLIDDTRRDPTLH